MNVRKGSLGVATCMDPDTVRQAAESLARARVAARDLERALAELCRLELHVTVRVEPGFEEGRLTPSTYFVEVEAT